MTKNLRSLKIYIWFLKILNKMIDISIFALDILVRNYCSYVELFMLIQKFQPQLCEVHGGHVQANKLQISDKLYVIVELLSYCVRSSIYFIFRI